MKEQFIENIVDVFELESSNVEFKDEFRDYEEWDSLTHLSLIAMLDDEYGVQIESEDFSKILTIQQLFDLVQPN